MHSWRPEMATIRRHVEPVTLCQADAARFCGLSVKAFRAEVRAGNGPRAFAPARVRGVSGSRVRYALRDLDEWIARMGIVQAEHQDGAA